MKKKFIKSLVGKITLSVGILSLAVSCIDKEDFDFDNFTGFEWTGSYAFPIINTSLTIRDLVADEDSLNLKEKPDGLIYLEYDESVESYDIRDDLRLPDKSFTKAYSLPNIKLPSLNTSIAIPASMLKVGGTASPASLYADVVSVTYSQGQITVMAKNETNSLITNLKIELYNKIDNTIIGTTTFTSVTGAPTSPDVPAPAIPLTGKTVKKDIGVRIITISPGSVTGTKSLTLTLTESNTKASEGEIILQEDVVINASEAIDFGLTPEQFHEALLKAGNFRYTLTSDIMYKTDATVSLPSIQNGGAPFSKVISFASAGTQNSAASLANYKADLTTLTPAYNRFPLSINVTCKKSVNTFKWKSTDKVTVDVQINGLEYKYLKGFFGSQTIALDEQSFDIEAFDNSLDGINMSFVDPKISFTVQNDYGVPISLDFKKFQASKDGVIKNFQTSPGNPIAIGSPALMGDKAVFTTVSVTNVNEIYNLGPNKIIYQVDGVLNNGATTGVNFVTDTSKVKVNMHAEIPLHGRASGIILEDTTENGLEEDIEEVEVETVQLRAVIRNEFPVDANVQIYFANDNYIITDSLFMPDQTRLITASTVDSNGNLVQAGVYNKPVEVNKEKFERLLKSPKMIIKAKLATAENGQKDVKIKSGYRLDVKLGVQTKLNIKIDTK